MTLACARPIKKKYPSPYKSAAFDYVFDRHQSQMLNAEQLRSHDRAIPDSALRR